MRKKAFNEKLRMMERVEKVACISMRIRYKNQELVILAMKMGMILRGWSGIWMV
jgi:CRISPR/Cas system CSM-associated protein Csm3 (group 7 of RAMP superfamily)